MRQRKTRGVAATATGKELAGIMADAFAHVDAIEAYLDHSLMARAIEEAFRRFAERHRKEAGGGRKEV